MLGILALLVLISVLIGSALGVGGLAMFLSGRESRRAGLFLVFFGAALQFWWVFFLAMTLYKTLVLKQDI